MHAVRHDDILDGAVHDRFDHIEPSFDDGEGLHEAALEGHLEHGLVRGKEIIVALIDGLSKRVNTGAFGLFICLAGGTMESIVERCPE